MCIEKQKKLRATDRPSKNEGKGNREKERGTENWETGYLASRRKTDAKRRRGRKRVCPDAAASVAGKKTS